MKFRRSQLQMRWAHLDHNVKALMKMAGSGFFCPMVKADAYGHGALPVSQRLVKMGVKALGVATVDEALELEGIKSQTQILIFSRFDPEATELVVAKGFVPVISRFEDLEEFEKQARLQGKHQPVHIKIDTGIHRMGFDVSDVPRIAEQLKRFSALKLSGLLSHLSHGEDSMTSNGHTQKQIDLFLKSIRELRDSNTALHLLNTAGLLGRSSAFKDAPVLGARPGMGMYGVLKDSRLSSHAVMRILSRVDQLRSLPKGEGVSYGWTWTAPRDSVVAVVPIGYADGYLRTLSNRSHMLIHGLRAPVVGTVCMDYCFLDVTDVVRKRGVNIGDEVVVMGEQGSDQITAEELAQKAQTISYEIVTGFGRHNRLEVNEVR